MSGPGYYRVKGDVETREYEDQPPTPDFEVQRMDIGEVVVPAMDHRDALMYGERMLRKRHRERFESVNHGIRYDPSAHCGTDFEGTAEFLRELDGVQLEGPDDGGRGFYRINRYRIIADGAEKECTDPVFTIAGSKSEALLAARVKATRDRQNAGYDTAFGISARASDVFFVGAFRQ